MGSTGQGPGYRISDTGSAGNFTDAVQLAAMTGTPPELSLVRTYTSKPGISANLEQQILPGIGLFARAGYTPGNLETYAFTDDDATLAGGASISGRFWARPGDTAGIAGILNTISKAHQAYLAAGGYTALIGDGALPNPGPEKILEAYHTLPVEPGNSASTINSSPIQPTTETGARHRSLRHACTRNFEIPRDLVARRSWTEQLD